MVTRCTLAAVLALLFAPVCASEDKSSHPYPLADANQALDDLRAGRFEGVAVLNMD